MHMTITESFRLSEQQRHLCALQRTEEAFPYSTYCAVLLEGPLDVSRLHSALKQLVARHEILRTDFPSTPGLMLPVQVINEAISLPLVIHDYRSLSSHEQEKALLQLREFVASFRLDAGPTWQVTLVRCDVERHWLIWNLSALNADTLTCHILTFELSQFYQWGAIREEGQEEPFQYADLAEWQYELLESAETSTERAYWRFLAQTSLKSPALPYATLKNQLLPFRPHSLEMGLSSDDYTRLETLSQQIGVTREALLFTCWGIVLSSLTAQPDLLIGTKYSGRKYEELTRAAGLFAKLLPLPCQFANTARFHEVAHQVSATMDEAYKWQEYFGWQLFGTMREQEPFCPFGFAYESLPPPWQAGVQQWSIEEQRIYLDRFEVYLSCLEKSQTIQVTLHYDHRYFAREDMQRLLDQWRVVLQQALASSDMELGSLELLTPYEQFLLLQEWNATRVDYPDGTCLHELFEEQVMRTADSIAVTYGDEQISYWELEQQANQLAHYLRRRGVGSEICVGLCLERSTLLLVSVLAVLKADGAYVPLDPSYPQERLAFMLQDAEVPLLLTQEKFLGRFLDEHRDVFCLDRDRAVVSCESNLAPTRKGSEEQLAYVLYTSGSTGRPKGVMVPHRGLVNYLRWAIQTYGVPDSNGAPLHSSIGFDLTVTSLFVPLLSGQRVLLLSEDEGVVALTTALGDGNNFCLVKVTPSHLEAINRSLSAEKLGEGTRSLIIGGEALWYETLSLWQSSASQTRLINEYGPTETVVGCCVYEVPSGVSSAGAVPIGRPIANMQMYVLNERLQPVPIGVTAELYVGGVGVTRGYLKRPELTAERFIPHPFTNQPGARLYRTGDLARYLPNGDLEYLGRIDQQVKIRGFRIEPGEIEAQLRLHPAIQEGVVIAREDTPGDKRLVAYVVLSQNASLSSQDLSQFLQQHLPVYMVPSVFVFLETLPLTSNGKVNYAALPVPDQRRSGLEAAYVPPRTPTEEILTGIWASVLELERVGINDNFFALGGDSIRSLRILSQAEERGIYFTLQQMFQYQTIHKLVQVLTTEESHLLNANDVEPLSLIAEEDRQKLPADVVDAYPLVMLQAGMLFHSQYSPQSGVYHELFSYHLQMPFDLPQFTKAIQQMMQAHPILRTSFDLSSYLEPLQLVHQDVELPLQVEDLSLSSTEEQEKLLAAWIEQEKLRPFDWMRAPLLRFHIHLRSEQSFQFSLSFHHAILDGWSVASLLTELFQRYLSPDRKETAAFDVPPTMQYRHFVALERQLMTSKETQHYWLNRLQGITATLLPRWPSVSQEASSSPANSLSIPISQETSAGLKQLARTCAVPLKSVLLAAHLRVLSLLTNQSTILTGLVSNGRPEISDSERVLGLFVNTLPFGLELTGGTWRELVQQTFKAECETLPHRWYPLAEVQRQTGGHALFETLFNFTHFHVYQGLAQLKSFRVLGGGGFTKTSFPLFANFSLDPVSSLIALDLQYDPVELAWEQVENIVNYYACVLSIMAGAPHARYDQVDLLPAYERQQVLTEWNDTTTEYTQEQCIHDLFVEQVKRTPDAVAVVFEGEHLSYAVLNLLADRLAAYLHTLGVGPDQTVGICLERSTAMLVGMLGVLKAGGAYVPLDPTYPRERLAFMLRDCQASIVVTQASLQQQIPSVPHLVLLPLAEEASLPNQPHQSGPERTVDAEQLAYVIYTSGSTGLPKGTMITHRAVNNFFNSMKRSPGLNAHDVVLALTSLSFDIAALELLLPLIVGARVQIVSRADAADGRKLIKWLEQCMITVMQATPATWRLLTSEQWMGKDGLKMLCGGEALSPELAAQLYGKGASLWNMYGPTETTIWSAISEISAQEERITIGRAIDNTQIYLLNHYGQLVPVGVVGELYIGGDGLARGYWQRTDLTAERFVPDAWSGRPGGRLYRAGDLARWLPDGRLECLGRIDHQVKVRGFRIELGEIETVLAQHPLVHAAVVTATVEKIQGDTRLAAYIVPSQVVPDSYEDEVSDLQLEQISDWTTVWDQTYRNSQTSSDPELNLAGWNSSYTGLPLPEEEMREWLDHTVRRILDLKPRSVLEIGCGTGLLLFRVAPHCDRYTGSDFSQAALASIQQRMLSMGGNLSHVSLKQSMADDFSGLGGEQYDVVILNSVAQYFPSLAYLRRTLEQAIQVVQPGGALFIGDVRSFPLLSAFHTSVRLAQTELSTTTIEQFQQEVHDQMAQEQELVVDPAFFFALSQSLSRPTHVEIQLKRGNSKNELAQFRYDVILHIEDQRYASLAEDQLWLDWQELHLTLPVVERTLEETAPAQLCLTAVPNARLQQEVTMLHLLATEQSSTTLAQLLQWLDQNPPQENAVEPESFYALGDELPYTVQVAWSRKGTMDCYDVVLQRRDRPVEQNIRKLTYLAGSPSSWHQYSNAPLLARFRRNPAIPLRRYLQGKLPDYMLPSYFTVLNTLPLTPNGKVDRRALPQATSTTSSNSTTWAAPRTPMEEILGALWGEILGQERVGIFDNFFELGGHSLLATQVMARIRASVQVDLPLMSLFEAPTIASLSRRIEQVLHGGQQPQDLSIITGPRPVFLPLSFAQQRLWFLDQLEPESTVYLLPRALRIEGNLDLVVLERCLTVLIERHESLRTTFEAQAGQPAQVIHPAAAFRLPLVDLSTLQQTERDAIGLQLAEQEAQTPCDLVRGPLMRCCVLRLAIQEHVLLLTMHHIISDGWSIEVLVHELILLYQAFVAGRPSPLQPLPIQYADFALWQRQWLQGQAMERQLTYWHTQLADVPLLELPTDHPRPPVQTFKGAYQSLYVSADLHKQLLSLGRQENVTLFMVLLAAFQVLLLRYTGQDDIAVGTPIANRTHAELEGLIGFFVNTLVLRTDLSGNPTFSNLLQRVRETALGAYSYQDLPFERLVEILQPERDLSRSPLFQVLFILQNVPRATEILEGLTLSTVAVQPGLAKFDLTLEIIPEAEGLQCGIEYNTDLFEAETIERLLGHWQTLLHGIVAAPSTPLLDLPLLTEAEQKQLVRTWNCTRTRELAEPTLVALFENQVVRTPDRVALSAEEGCLSYAQLNQRANQLAHYLRTSGVTTDGIVGVAVDRSLWLSIAVLGVLKAGGAYLPLDPSYPVSRLASMLTTARASLVITTEMYQPQMTILSEHLTDLNLASTRAEQKQPIQAIYLDAIWEQGVDTASSMKQSRIGQQSRENLQIPLHRENLAYLIYTSGSTGEPKGAMNTHRGIVNRIQWIQTTHPLQSEDRVLQKTPISFDISVWELFWPLVVGAQLVMARPEGHRDSAYLTEVIREQQISIIHFVPSMLQVFLEEEGIERCESLRQVISSGEALSVPLQERFFSKLTADLHNLYGPTEAAVEVTAWTCQRQSKKAVVPIGRPISNIQIFVLDAHMQPVPVGVAGELYIGGVAVARGYCGDPIRTAERFVPNPFAGQEVEPLQKSDWWTRLYRTGDRARYLADGSIEYLGRLDDQVKLRGYRIELNEIITVLSQHPEVQHCTVIVREDKPGRKQLVAYCVPTAPSMLDSDEAKRSLFSSLRDQAKAFLPEYMVPTAFVLLQQLPVTANGKLDRRALPAPEMGSINSNKAHVEAHTPIEALLLKTWSDVLKQSHISIDDNFFDLGGDSILSIQIVARVKQAGLHITPKLLFQHPTIVALAAAIAETSPVLPFVAAQRLVTGATPLSPIQHWFFAQNLAVPQHFNQALMLRVQRPLKLALLQQALSALIAHHDALRLRFSQVTNQTWVQTHAPVEADLPLTAISLAGLSGSQQQIAIKACVAAAQASLNLQSGPLLRVLYFDSGLYQQARIFIVVHHLVIDGVSWRILLEDLQSAYEQLAAGQTVQLPAKTTSFQYWATSLKTYAQQEDLLREAAFWQERLQGVSSALPTDTHLGANTVASTRTITCELSQAETWALLHEVPSVYQTRVNDILLAAFAQTLAAWTGENTALFHLEGHGREELFEEVDLSRTIGWFTSLFPVSLDLSAIGKYPQPGELLKAVKQQLRTIPRNGIGYGLLRYLSEDRVIAEQMQNLPQPAISFNYLGQFQQTFSEQGLLGVSSELGDSDELEESGSGPDNVRAHLIDVNGGVIKDQLHMSWTYSQHFHTAETITALAQSYMQTLRKLIAHCQAMTAGSYLPDDFPLAHLSQSQLNTFQARYPALEDIYPLSPLQEGLLFHTLSQPQSGVYIIQLAWTFQGKLSLEVFERAWQLIFARHAILRTAFAWDGENQYLQVVQQGIQMPLQILDWRGLSQQEQQEQRYSVQQANRARGFTLDEAPLMRFILAYEADDRIFALWSYHHLILDGWSTSYLLAEALSVYQQLCINRQPVVTSSRSYRDYIAWLQQQDLTQAEYFWRHRLAGFTEPTPVPAIQGAIPDRIWSGTGKIAHEVLQLSQDLTEQLHTRARIHQLTVHTFIQGAWALLLHHYSGKTDIVFGSTVAGRSAGLAGMESMIGLLINTLPMRVQIEPQVAAWKWLKTLQDQLIETLQYEYAPLAKIQEWSEVSRGLALFESLLVFENYPINDSIGTQVEALEVLDSQVVEQTNYPITFTVAPQNSLLTCTLSYDTAQFDPEAIRRLLGHWQNLLEGLVTQPEQCLSEIAFLTVNERQQLLVEWNTTTTTYPQVSCLHELFEEQVERTPEAIALVCEAQQLTYGELNARANHLARALQKLNVGPEIVVGICLERSIEMIIGLLGILKAGGAYLPLDLSLPPERLAFMLADAQVKLLLTQQSLQARFDSLPVQLLCLDCWAADIIHPLPQENPVSQTRSEHLAYVIYTSGSTGQPKGVLVNHKQVVRLFATTYPWSQFDEHDCWTLFHSIAFDFSVWELWGALLYGGRLVVVPFWQSRSPESFYQLLAEQQVSVLNQTSSAFRQLLEAEREAIHIAELQRLRLIIFGGEALDMQSVQSWFAHHGDHMPQLVNMYGITETTVHVTSCPLTLHNGPREGQSPIGRPLSDLQVYVLDAAGQLLPIGVTGEMYVGGAGLSRGYLNRPELTAERFVPHSFSQEPGARLYRTGDLAYYNQDGTLEFVGRADRQVKVRGYRIELGEIETQLRQLPAIQTAIVLLREDRPQEQQLVAYIVLQPDEAISGSDIRGFLQKKLPDYMQPSHVVFLKSLPLTSNGKLDRRALPAPEELFDDIKNEFVAPRTELEHRLADIWCQVLHLERVGVHNNFFDLGGHSLLAMRLISRIRSELQVEMPLRLLFEAPTIAEQAQQVLQMLEHIPTLLQAPPIVSVAREQVLPLSFAQQRLWFLDQLEPQSAAYNISRVLRMEGDLVVHALDYALMKIVKRHESLRTIFQSRDGHPVQIIEAVSRFHLQHIDIRGLSRGQRESEIQRLVLEEVGRPFDLAQGPLLRVALLHLTDKQWVFLFSIHHIISDGWSMDIFTRELVSLYNAFVAGLPSPLPPVAIQYADFALWQRTWLQGEVLDAQMHYWTEQLKDIAPLDLPIDHPRPAIQSLQGAHQILVLSSSLSAELRALSRREGVTLFIMLLAAFQVLLFRYTGQNDIAVGTPVANRTRKELEGLIGFFVNTLVLRTDFSGNPRFVDLLHRVRDVTLEAYAHQDVPFEKIVEELHPQRNLATSPLFQVMFILQDAAFSTEALTNVTLQELEHSSVTSKFDLTFTIEADPQGFLCHLEYSTDLFEPTTIQRLLEHWQTLLNGLVARPMQRLSNLPLLTARERSQLLRDWNSGTRELPGAPYVHRLFEQQAEQTPDALAVRCQDGSLTYAALNLQANRLAQALITHGATLEEPVAVFVERSPLLVIALLAIWKAGGVYLPLDPLYPIQRIDQILRQSRSALILVDKHTLPLLGEIADMAEVKSIVLETVLGPSPDNTYLLNLPCRLAPNNLAYIIYTSGSTGQPKGVMVGQQGMLNHMLAKIADIQLGADDHVAQIGPQGFDVSIWQSLAALMLGGLVEILPDEIAFNPQFLLQQVEERAITQLQVVPSMLRALLLELDGQNAHADRGADPALNALRCLIPTGDALPAELCQRWWHYYPEMPILNTYGSTECSDDQCHYLLTAGALPPKEVELPIVPVGFPIANMQAYVLDQHLMLVPFGVVGELYLGGLGVGRGYLDDPVRTAQVFVPDPYGCQAGARLYKTGDLVRRLPNGNIEFIGRRDFLVKMRGYRIELGEIEAALGQHPSVQECVVVVTGEQYEDARKALVAYIVPNGLVRPSSDELRTHLQGKLPDYMLPQWFVFLDTLPLNSNGKVDRKLLPVPKTDERGVSAARTPLEELLSEIWRQVLQLSQVSVQDNFFAVGGHSLLATQVISRIRALLQIELPLRRVFEAPTIAMLAECIELEVRQKQGLSARPSLIAMTRPDDIPLSFAQQRLWFLQRIEPENPAYILYGAARLSGRLVVPVLFRSLEEIVQRHESLRTTFEERRKTVVQVIHANATFELRQYDMSHLPLAEQKLEVERLIQQEVRRPFDLVHGPLLRALLFRHSTEEHVLLLTTHHIISDAWSVQVLLREMATLYHALLVGLPSPLSPLSIQYADFALWQRSWLKDEVLDTLINYWQKQLRGATPLELPADRPRQAVASNQGAIYSFTVPAQLTRALQTLSREEGVTLFMTLLATFQILLHRYTRQQDIVVGTDIANRTYIELEDLIGFFVNLLVLRSRITAQNTFRQVLQQARTVLLDAYMHQDLPFEKLVETLKLERAGQQVPLVNTLFVMQNIQPASLAFEGVTITPWPVENHTAKFDLAMFMVEEEQGLFGSVNYRTDLFDASSIVRFCNHFVTLLHSVIAAPDGAIKNLEMETAEEKAQQASEEILRREAGRSKLKVVRRSAIKLNGSDASSSPDEER